ncbi:MAG: hypothetical protein WC365_05350 [Candidatus Babeliales bacterium]|jgi:transcription elongation factor Elf1
MTTVENCWSCPRFLKQQRTPEGYKFCVYCNFRFETIRRNGCDADVNSYTFETDERMMGLYNRMQYWKSAPFKCPACNCVDFSVDIELRVVPQIGVFKSTPIRRAVIVCKQCNKRYYPDDTMRSHDLSEGIM